MWSIVNQTPYAADRAFVRDRDGAEIWIVAVRATFDIRSDGSVAVAEKQIPVALAPEWTADPGRSSLRWDMDLVRTKPGTDVIVNASAHAPGGKPVTQLEVGLALGPINKILIVHGNRRFGGGLLGSTSDPEPFVEMPIRYERAHGGQILDLQTQELRSRIDTNPIGCGLSKKAGEPCPNVELPRQFLGSSQAAAGFGAIPANWQPRLSRAGTYDEQWAKTRQPLVPADFQDGHFHCAPADQQVAGHLRGGESGALFNLCAQSVLRFTLPRVRLGFTTHIAARAEHHLARLHTVILEPSDRRLIMVWHTALPCHHTLYTLKRTIVFEKEWTTADEHAAARAAPAGVS